jgi:hypothetical protein
LNEYESYHLESEYITIVEGPPPEFAKLTDVWPLSLHDGPEPAAQAVCKLRTFNGEEMLERCRRAWAEGRPVRLDYPNRDGERMEADIVATRAETIDQGDLIYLWVRL